MCCDSETEPYSSNGRVKNMQIEIRTGHLAAGAAVAATLFGAAAALAAPIVLPSGPVFGKFLGVEQVSPTNMTPGGPFPATSGTTGADCAGCGNENLTTDKEGTFGVFVIDTLSAGSVTVPHQD